MKDKLRFESVEEKRNRRQLRVQRLESEEADLVDSIGKANLSLEHVLTTTTSELKQRLTTAKEVFSKDMGNLSLALKRFHTLQQQFVQALVSPFQQFEEICKGIDLNADFTSYISAILTSAGACRLTSQQDPTGVAIVLLELPETLQFVCTKSAIVEEERRVLKSGTLSPVNGANANAAAATAALDQGPFSGRSSIFSNNGPSSNNNHAAGGGAGSSSSSGGLSTIGLGREGREKAHSAVKKLFSSSASSMTSPVMKPDSLMKKLTNRGGAVSPVVNHVPQVTPAQEGASLLLSPGGVGGGGETGIIQLRQGTHPTY